MNSHPASPIDLVVFEGDVPDDMAHHASGAQEWANLLIRTASEHAPDEAARTQLTELVAARAVSLSVLFPSQTKETGPMAVNHPTSGSLALRGSAVTLVSEVIDERRQELDFTRTETGMYRLTGIRLRHHSSELQAWPLPESLSPEAAQKNRYIANILRGLHTGTEVAARSLTDSDFGHGPVTITIEPA